MVFSPVAKEGLQLTNSELNKDLEDFIKGLILNNLRVEMNKGFFGSPSFLEITYDGIVVDQVSLVTH